MSFYNQVISYSKELNSTKSKNSELEVEIRFGEFEKYFKHELTSRKFYSLLNRLNQKYELVKSNEESTDSYYKLIQNGRITDDGKMLIKEKKSFDNKQYGIRISVATETITDAPKNKGPKLFDRKKIRTIYKIRDGVEFHLTKVFTRDREIFETEIEININQIDDLESIVNQSFSIFYDTNFMYTVAEKNGRFSLVNNYLMSDKKYRVDIGKIPKARNLHWNDMRSGFMFNGEFDYFASVKADGENKFLLINNDSIYLLNSSSDINKVNRFKIEKKKLSKKKDINYLFNHYNSILIQGEYTINKDDTLLFNAFDIIGAKGKSFVELIYSERLRHLNGIVRDIVEANIEMQVRIKPAYNFNHAKNMFKICNQILDTNYPFETDGIVFTPNTIYNPEESENKEFVSSILKWKPENMLTIDFKFINNEPYSYSRETKKLEKFMGTEENPLPNEYEILIPNEIESIDDKVVETFYNKNENRFLIIKVRHDKITPNLDWVSKDIWNDLFDPISEDVIRGKKIELFNLAINNVKSDLINENSIEGNLLLIGSDKLMYDGYLKSINKEIYQIVKDDNDRELTKNIHRIENLNYEEVKNFILDVRPGVVFMDTSSYIVDFSSQDETVKFLELVYFITELCPFIILDVSVDKVKNLVDKDFKYSIFESLDIELKKSQSNGISIEFNDTRCFLGLNNMKTLNKNIKQLNNIKTNYVEDLPQVELSTVGETIYSLFSYIVVTKKK